MFFCAAKSLHEPHQIIVTPGLQFILEVMVMLSGHPVMYQLFDLLVRDVLDDRCIITMSCAYTGFYRIPLTHQPQPRDGYPLRLMTNSTSTTNLWQTCKTRNLPSSTKPKRRKGSEIPKNKDQLQLCLFLFVLFESWRATCGTPWNTTKKKRTKSRRRKQTSLDEDGKLWGLHPCTSVVKKLSLWRLNFN